MAMPEWLQRKKAKERCEAQARKAEYIAKADQLAAKVKSHMKAYKENRDAIAVALHEVFTQHYYMGEYGESFRDWFDAQGFNFSYRTARFYIAEVKKAKSGNVCHSASKKPPQNVVVKTLERAISVIRKVFEADPFPGYDDAIKYLERALKVCREGADG